MSFIESQFPVAKLSSESHKERKSSRQTLTGLGKWWGRKPLVLVRAILLGCLLPATSDPKRDREVFLKLMTMDDEGLRKRRKKKSGDKEFSSLSYGEKLRECLRPEEIAGPSPQAWEEINAHLGTSASSLQQLVEQLGEHRYGHKPIVTDVFCGGGSIPFEAARIGCNVDASDLNPVACLLTWASLNLLNISDEEKKEIAEVQNRLHADIEARIASWGIEHNSDGWHADTYLYCVEAPCPECNWKVPLAPSWVISEKQRVICRLIPDPEKRCFNFAVGQAASPEEYCQADKGTVGDRKMHCPHCGQSVAIATLRGDRKIDGTTVNGLRLWEKSDFQARPGDIYQERLYCIRWEVTDSRGKTIRHYAAPTEEDLRREERVVELLAEHFESWQTEGFIPSRAIEVGYNTKQPIKERGWTHWHHLFNARQLLGIGLESQGIFEVGIPLMLLQFSKGIDFCSKLCRWEISRDNLCNVFYNQALNVNWNYPCRTVFAHTVRDLQILNSVATSSIAIRDARTASTLFDIAITDPPYADAVNYDELSEFFLAWLEPHLKKHFPDWYTDSKRALAIRGAGEGFNKSMVACYRNLALHMSDDGMQVITFTHQDAAVWASLALILWTAGLHVTAAWTIATETSSALKQGNYVQGTVIMVCRKRLSTETVFLDELLPQIETEVEKQLQQMLDLDDTHEPNFGDSDYQLAAYAAALRVLTSYGSIEDIDVERELMRTKADAKSSPVVKLIENAVRIASDYLIPKGLDGELWRNCTPVERFYLKGIELESRGEQRQGVYQEFARGFGLKEYTSLLAKSSKANETRLRTASELARRNLGDDAFGLSPLRKLLFAIYTGVKANNAKSALITLKDEFKDGLWKQSKSLAALARYLSRLSVSHWKEDAHMAGLIEGLLLNGGLYV